MGQTVLWDTQHAGAINELQMGVMGWEVRLEKRWADYLIRWLSSWAGVEIDKKLPSF